MPLDSRRTPDRSRGIVPAFRLLIVTDRKALGAEPLDDRLARLCWNGLRGVQLREKDLDEAALLALAAQCRPVFDVSAARAAVGPALLVGHSVHSADAAGEAAKAGADYIIFGPVFDTPAKRSYGSPLGTGSLREACAAAGAVPVYAIGGVGPERVGACLAAGARGVAVMSPLMGENGAEDNLARYGHELSGL
jgi:thiamine-phosphate pyrophosphorylase